MTAEFTLRKVRSLLGQFAFRYSSEVQLHERIADVLLDAGFSFEREVELDAKNRADFVIDGGVVIEVKVDGDMGSALSQARRYSKIEGVTGVLLASACGWARGLPETLPTSTTTTVATADGTHVRTEDRATPIPVQVVHLKRQAL